MNPVWHFVDGVPQIGPPVVLGPLSVSASAVTSSVPIVLGTNDTAELRVLAANGTTSVYGLWYDSGNNLSLGGLSSGAKTATWYIDGAGGSLTANGTRALNLGSNGTLNIGDVSLSRGQAGQLNSNSSIARTGANGQLLNAFQALTELTTIAAAAFTDTTIQMPANAQVRSVSVRVTTLIPTAATFTVGDSGSAARFSTAAVAVAAGSTDPGTKAGLYYNASALSIRITPNLTPADNTGRVRVTILYDTVTPPTS